MKPYQENERKARSEQYQFKFHEVNVANDFLCSFTNDQSIYNFLNPFSYSEVRLELLDKIKERVNQLIQTHLTAKQLRIWNMYSSGMTQVEIAKVLKINQSNITKTINGNSSSYKPKVVPYAKHGGIFLKMKKAAAKDPQLVQWIRELKELQEE